MIKQKIHINRDDVLIALCDSDLIGQELSEGSAFLKVDPDFYSGEELNEADFDDHVKKPCNINAVGAEAIEFLEKKGLVEEIKTIQEVPYAIVVVRTEE